MNKKELILFQLLLVLIIIAILSLVIFVEMTGPLETEEDLECHKIQDNLTNLWGYFQIHGCALEGYPQYADMYNSTECPKIKEEINKTTILWDECNKNKLNSSIESTTTEENETSNFTNSTPLYLIPILPLDNSSEDQGNLSRNNSSEISICGNCECEEREDKILCPNDCGECGDRFCSNCTNLNENSRTCPTDCSFN